MQGGKSPALIDPPRPWGHSQFSPGGSHDPNHVLGAGMEVRESLWMNLQIFVPGLPIPSVNRRLLSHGNKRNPKL